MYSVQYMYTMYSVQCTVYNVQWTVGASVSTPAAAALSIINCPLSPFTDTLPLT